jgi:Zn-dependent protease with chaperone function
VNIPIEAAFAMLAIEMYRSLAGPEAARPPEGWIVLAATGGWIVFQYVVAAWLARRTRRRLRRAHTSTVEIFEDFRFRQVIQRVLLVVLCFAHIHFTRWPTFVEERLHLPSWSVLDDVVAIAPFALAMFAGWVAIYRTDRMLSRRSWGLGEFVWFQARYSLLLVLLPWLVLKGVFDSAELWPPALQDLAENTWLMMAAFALIVVATAVFVPVFLKWLFAGRSMPPSEMRSRLEALCERAGFTCRDILVWRMERARILNAGIMGVVPRYRYVLFSDALLDSLSPAECEAVLAHEIGHSKHKHVLVYLAFTLGFVALAYVVLALLPQGFRSEFLFGMPVLGTLVLVYFRFLFGYLSRTFERQSDVYAAGLVGTPAPLVLALEKIALMSGDIRELKSWRHDSVAARVRRLSEIGYDEEAQERYNRKVGRVVRAVAIAVVALFALSWYTAFREPEGLSAEIARWRARAERRRFDHYIWTRLGALEARAGNFEAAREAFGTALTNNPKFTDALDGLERLPIREGAKARTLAEAYHEAGLVEEAFRTLEALFEAGPPGGAGTTAPENHVLLARFLMDKASGDRRDLEAARAHALRAVELEEAKGAVRAETYQVTGRVYLESGDAVGAEAYARKALEAAPADAGVEELLQRIRAAGEKTK